MDKSGLLDTLQNNGVGCIAFTPLAQGLLTGKYLNGIPQDSRMYREGNKVRGLTPKMLTEANLNSLRLLNEMAQQRGQSMAQMALSWLLKDERVTSVLIGAEGNKVRGLTPKMLTEANLNSLRLLNEMAQQRGQSMAQMALSWLLKDERVTSVLIGASRPEQLEENVQALNNLAFSAEELAQIDQHIADGELNLWQASSDK